MKSVQNNDLFASLVRRAPCASALCRTSFSPARSPPESCSLWNVCDCLQEESNRPVAKRHQPRLRHERAARVPQGNSELLAAIRPHSKAAFITHPCTTTNCPAAPVIKRLIRMAYASASPWRFNFSPPLLVPPQRTSIVEDMT